MLTFNRRDLVLSSAASAAALASAHASPSRFAALERAVGGRVGVYAKRDGDATTVSNRPKERFAMCSTFKAPLAACILDEVDNGGLDASQPIRIDEARLIGWSPEVEPRRRAGIRYMSLAGLCRAAVVESDNTAANILLDLLGGPAGFTRKIRRFEGSTRLDRYEPDLNENAPGDSRDTTTPEGMSSLLGRLLLEDGFSQRAAAQTRGLMIDCATGAGRLRAGLPPTLVVGNKTGTSLNGLYADIALIDTADGRAPVIVAAYIDAPSADRETGARALAEVGRIVAGAFQL